MSQALFGPSGGARLLSAGCLLALGLSSLAADSDIYFFFGLYAALVQGRPEVACRDELTPLSGARRTAAYAAAVFVLLALLPLPAALDPFPSPFSAALG